ncbi:glycosyltransferase family protein [Amycolatopsis alkalitolerans]|uniref:Uncharacterized protein n=1 Tax=Amycolatopsis alkalitolerans TaxID=2547244 RepID=A0A5C4LXT9_9PSEU|nr:hypothetical protein [Amycolatopsis alkalitolerans]TNC23426.1 hypothetical protein FG385_22090 [Amycolatopsis alkalitolerans]
MAQLVDVSPDGLGVAEPSVARRRWSRWNAAWWVGALAFVAGLAFVIGSVIWNSGKLFAPLDDVYIHLQYGRQLGSGYFFQFNTGDEISAGASSMLYSFILGAAYAAGAHGGFFLAFAVAFNVGCFAVSAALTCLLGARLVNRTVGVWAGVLVALSGPLLWGAASGMEVGLVMLLVTGLLYTFVREQVAARFRGTPVVAALLALVRPEGLIFAAAITCAVLWTLWTRRRRTMLGWALWSLLPLAVGAGQLLFYRLATGTTSANGVQAKSMLYDAPVFYLGEFADRLTATLRSLAGTFLGYTSQDFAFPGALLIAGVGAAYLLLERSRRPLVIAVLAGLGAAVLSLSTLDTALYHELRYYQPFVPVFLLLVVSGIYGLARMLSQPRARRFALHGGLAVALAFSLIAVPMWGVRYARAAAGIRETDVSYAVWMKDNLPAGATVAVKDVGAVAYFSGHRIVDLLGLGTNGLAEPVNNGIGSLYEAVRHLPARPGYFATYDTGPGPTMAPLRDVGVLEQPAVATFEVVTPPDLRGIVSVPFKEFTVARADWSLADNADKLSGDVRDYLNVAYLDAEKAHGYQYLPAQTAIQPWTLLAREDDVIDSGRAIIGGEAFTMSGLTPGHDAILTARTAMHGDAGMRVLVNGSLVGTWTREDTEGPWDYSTFTIPGSVITDSAVHIELRQLQPPLGPYPDYTSFGYWITQ